MLKKFEVKNFKGFKNKLILDLSATRDYSFNSKLIRNGLVNKGLIYGKNGTGKSNLGLAMFDITWHLTEKRKINTIYAYTHGDSPRGSTAFFKYYFQLGGDSIEYEYEKYTPTNLKYEKLWRNGSLIIDYNHDTKTVAKINVAGAETLNFSLDRNDQSIIRYIYRNARLGKESIIAKMMNFVDNMLWFRSLEGNEFSGYKRESEGLADMIATRENLDKFSEFLAQNDIHYKLDFAEDLLNNKKYVSAKFKHNEYPLTSISSRGTDALFLFYCWSLEFDKISFLFLDEFDAFYHYESAELILNFINNKANFQSLLTTHNTTLLSNELTRPDCSYILSNNAINNLCNCTQKEIREAHNLEKMYRNGIFED